MMNSDSSNNKRSLEFELNLVPFIDMLSSCITFLLLTAVWTYLGSMDTTQAIGAKNQAEAQNPPSLVVQLDKDNSFDFQLKDISTQNRNFTIKAVDGKPHWEKVDKFLKAIREKYPELKTSVVLARPNVTYGHTIKIVDALKKAEITDVGISPI